MHRRPPTLHGAAGAAPTAKLNPYRVFMGWNPAPDWAAQSPKGFDAVSHYARASHLPADFAGLVREQEEWMWGGAAKDRVPYIPLVTTGWNKEPRKDNPASWEVGHGYLKQTVFIPPATAGEIATHLQSTLTFVKENPKTCLANAIIMCAWNEQAAHFPARRHPPRAPTRRRRCKIIIP